MYESGRKTLAGTATPGVMLANMTISAALRSSLRAIRHGEESSEHPLCNTGRSRATRRHDSAERANVLVRLRVGG